MSICQTGWPVACTQCASRTEAHCSASLRACSASLRACSASLRACSASLRACSASLRACSASLRACSASLRACSASLRAWRFSARATVVRARFLAAAFSDGSYLAHVNGAYLRHVKCSSSRLSLNVGRYPGWSKVHDGEHTVPYFSIMC